MKEEEIKEVVDKYSKNIDKSFHKMLMHFDITDIQQFRLDIKIIRAFFHLLDMESGGGSQIKISARMKTVYGYTGIIRNLQLLVQTINKCSEFSTNTISISFINKLVNEISYWEKTIKEYIYPDDHFKADKIKLVSEIPARLRKRSIKKFTGYVNHEIQRLLTRFDEENLNSIRKLLEDVLYNWDLLLPFVSNLSEGLRNEEEVQFLYNNLSMFKDKCSACTLLGTYYNDSETGEEKAVLADIIQIYKTEKDNIKDKVCSELGRIPVQPIVKRAFTL